MSFLDSVEHDPKFFRLDDKRNWISEWAKIKKSIPENCVKKLKSDDNEQIKKSLGCIYKEKNQLQICYRISVTSVYLSHSMSPSHC
jgi:hypothetical protein